MSLLRQRIHDTAEADYQAGNFAAVATALNTPRHAIEDHEPGGFDKASARLSAAQIDAVLAVMEQHATTFAPLSGLVAHGLRKFSASALDFARAETQALFDSLPAISGGSITQEVADQLKAIGIRIESDADQLNSGVAFAAGDIEALANAEAADLIRNAMAQHLASINQQAQDQIDAGTLTTTEQVDQSLRDILGG